MKTCTIYFNLHSSDEIINNLVLNALNKIATYCFGLKNAQIIHIEISKELFDDRILKFISYHLNNDNIVLENNKNTITIKSPIINTPLNLLLNINCIPYEVIEAFSNNKILMSVVHHGEELSIFDISSEALQSIKSVINETIEVISKIKNKEFPKLDENYTYVDEQDFIKKYNPYIWWNVITFS